MAKPDPPPKIAIYADDSMLVAIVPGRTATMIVLGMRAPEGIDMALWQRAQRDQRERNKHG